MTWKRCIWAGKGVNNMSKKTKRELPIKKDKQLSSGIVCAIAFTATGLLSLLPMWILVAEPILIELVGNWYYIIFLFAEMGFVLAIYGLWRLISNLSSPEDE